MKKTFILLILSFVVVSQQFSMTVANPNPTSDKDIPLVKEPVRPQPHRVQSLKSFTASYNNQLLYISSYGYSGNVQVKIIGIDGFDYSYYTDNTNNTQYIDISTLSEGIYILNIITSSGFIYTGEFEL